MGYYFDDGLNMFHHMGDQVDDTLSVVANHYMELNPPGPLTFRAYSTRGIQPGYR